MNRAIFHVITGLDRGGAETMLLKLIRATDARQYRHVVFVLTNSSAMLPEFREQGIDVRKLNVRGVGSLLRALLTTRRAVVSERPVVLMSWLHHADLFAALLKLMHPSLRFVWNIRCSKLSPTELPWGNILLVRLLAFLSFIPAAVATNSIAGRNEHAAIGYRPRRWVILPNGFDTNAFKPDKAAGMVLRLTLGLGQQNFVVGMVGRYHPMKGYGLFAEAAAIVRRRNPDIRFVMIGSGLSKENTALTKLLDHHGIGGITELLGERKNVPELMNALDVLLSTSTSEGFPNVIGEAMSCGIPCVATDVGDCRSVIGDSGLTVEAGSAMAVAEALERLATMPREQLSVLGMSARRRIEEHFGMPAVLRRYQDLFDEFA
jgi:glycosyltransferase involved in cell wall biosynthesis